MGSVRGRKSKTTANTPTTHTDTTFSPSRHVKDKPGGAAVWPSDCVRRLAVPHTGTPLITGAGLSLLDTKTPHADTTAYTCTCKHANTMNAWEHRGKNNKTAETEERRF